MQKSYVHRDRHLKSLQRKCQMHIIIWRSNVVVLRKTRVTGEDDRDKTPIRVMCCFSILTVDCRNSYIKVNLLFYFSIPPELKPSRNGLKHTASLGPGGEVAFNR